MIVLGIDPGLAFTGYACVGCSGDRESPSLIEAGVFRFDRRHSVSERLLELQHDLASLIKRCRPECVCVESLFAHWAHPRTAIIMAHARGVILLTVQQASLPLLELPPAEVKKATTGHGRASKPQMQHAVMTLLGLASPPQPPDVADAIAVAMCGLHRMPATSVDEDGRVEPRAVTIGSARSRVRLRAR